MAEAETAHADVAEIARWFAEHLPAEWGATAVDVDADGEEVVVTVALPDPPVGPTSFGEGAEAHLAWFRAQTRDERMVLATAAEARFGRKVSWGARTGAHRAMFTTMSVPVMTRLRLPERRVLDTLIAAGVARSRSEALAWCVRLVGDNEEEWVGRLREAMTAVDAVRREGPAARRRR